jgi:hypothetical protein
LEPTKNHLYKSKNTTPHKAEQAFTCRSLTSCCLPCVTRVIVWLSNSEKRGRAWLSCEFLHVEDIHAILDLAFRRALGFFQSLSISSSGRSPCSKMHSGLSEAR